MARKPRPRRYLPHWVVVALPFVGFRYSARRHAYVLRLVGDQRGPVVRERGQPTRRRPRPRPLRDGGEKMSQADPGSGVSLEQAGGANVAAEAGHRAVPDEALMDASLVRDDHKARAQGVAGVSPESPSAAPASEASPPPTRGRAVRRGWTGPRIAAVVIGSLLGLVSLGILVLGGGATWLQTHRDDGYVSAESQSLTAPGYALASAPVGTGAGWRGLLGTLRVRATGRSPTTQVFLGIAPAGYVANYLAGVQYTTVNDMLLYGRGPNVSHDGRAPTTPPAMAGIWTVQAIGTGTQTLVWPVRPGIWSVVAMNTDGAPGVSVRANLGATFPPLHWVATGLVAGGALLLAVSAPLVILPVRRATRRG